MLSLRAMSQVGDAPIAVEISLARGASHHPF
jgi:hypothetical protein